MINNEKSKQLKISLASPPVKEYKNIEYFIGALGLIIIGVCFLLKRQGFSYTLGYHLIFISGGLLLLLSASNIVLEYAVKLAEIMGVSSLVIGLTLVSIGTSIPEIFTSIISSMRNVGGFAIGDIYGSYITQLTLILGVVILIIPTTVNRSFSPHILRDGTLVVIALLILSIELADGYISRLEGLISILLYIGYTLYLYHSTKTSEDSKKEQLRIFNEMEKDLGIHSSKEISDRSAEFTETILKLESYNSKSTLHLTKEKRTKLQIAFFIFMIFFGALFTYFGADIVVTHGVSIAHSLNVSEHIIAATIVGAGTAIPEFAVSVNAARRNNPDIAYGNLLGSNIVDPLFSISLGVMIQPISLSQFAINHILYKTLPIGIIVVLFTIVMFLREKSSKRSGYIIGVSLLMMYALFLFLAFFNK